MGNEGSSDGQPQTKPNEISPDVAYQAAIRDPRVPRVYGNHVTTVAAVHDISLMFGVNGVPSGLVTIPYALAKTMSQNLAKVVAEYERASGLVIPDADKLEEALRKASL
jgi:hypothetical protein